MNEALPLPSATCNQDLLRASAHSLPANQVAAALRWLHGHGPFPKPTSIHLDLTLRCTARCVHCKQWTWPAQTEFSASDFARLISVFKSWGVGTITLGGGNPLLHPDIVRALQLTKEAGIRIGIITEGMELSDELVHAICQNAEWIRFSLDGPDAAIHDSLRNASGLFQLVASGVARLKSCTHRPRIGLNCVVQKDNVASLPRMLDLADQLGVDVLTFKLPHGDDPSKKFLLSHDDLRSFVDWVRSVSGSPQHAVRTNLDELRGLFDTAFREPDDVVAGRPVRKFYSTEQVRCFAPLFFLTCDSSGNMYPCDYLQADTRLWGGKYGLMRNEFSVGNVLADGDAVLVRLEEMMRARVHGLPASGYDECGCCTRFCQLNAALTELDQSLADRIPDASLIQEILQSRGPPSPQFL